MIKKAGMAEEKKATKNEEFGRKKCFSRIAVAGLEAFDDNHYRGVTRSC